jgi:soluble lytic murein transglycosylase
MLRGSELWTVAAYDDAKGEFESLTQDNEKNPLAMYQLASYYYRIGQYYEAINTTAKMLDDAKVETIDAPKAIAAMRFPIAYYDLVLPAAQKYNVDPLLVFSVIRQESLYQGVATSYASAQGLMQIIPDTGAYIARKLNWDNFQNSDLYKPYVNVTFGVFYLREQLDTFNNNVYAALAAYNAGPGPVDDWLHISNSDPDLFIQAIDIDQTQTYVQRIYEQYETYVHVYAAK